MTQADLGNNFFVDEDCLGKSRAASVTQMLQELNEHVSGSYVAEDISQVLDSRPDFLDSFNLLIATQLASKDVDRVAKICAERRIKLLVVHSYGFMGCMPPLPPRPWLRPRPLPCAQPEPSLRPVPAPAPPPPRFRRCPAPASPPTHPWPSTRPSPPAPALTQVHPHDAR